MFPNHRSLAAAALFLAGCATADLTNEGAQVATSNTAPSAEGYDPHRCRSLGFVVGRGGGSFGGAWISNEDLVKYAMNDLRNKAAEMGANYIQHDTPQMGVAGDQNGTTTSTVTISGTAYHCDGVTSQLASSEDPSSPSSDPKQAPAHHDVAAPTGVAGFTLGSTLEDAQAACEAKNQWTPSGTDVFECSGTPRSIGTDARSLLKFCGGSLCRAVFVARPNSDQSSEWLRQFVLLKKVLVGKYGDPVEDKVVPDQCANDILPCVRNGAAHAKYTWTFPNGTFVVLVLSNKPGPDPLIRLTYALGAQQEAPAL